MRRCLAIGALAVVLAALLSVVTADTARAATAAGWGAADHARHLVADRTPLSDPGADIAMFITAWQGLVTTEADWFAALQALPPDGRRRTDPAARVLANAACGGSLTFAWDVTRAEQPERGDPVFYRPARSDDGLPSPLHVGIVVSQTAVVVVQPIDGAERAAVVGRELLFHAQQANAGDTPVADAAEEVSFCHVSTALIPPSLRAAPGSPGAVRLVDPAQVADTLAWNADHPRDRGGLPAILRVLEIFALIPGAGAGALAGLLVFGLAAVHDGSEGALAALTAPFAAVRAGLTWTFDGGPVHRVLTVILLSLLGFRLLGFSFTAGLGIAVGVGVAGALQLATNGRFPLLSWFFVPVWTVASWLVSVVTGVDDAGHVSGVSIALALAGDVALVLGGSRLLAMAGPLGVILRTSAPARAIATIAERMGLGRLGGTRLVRLAGDANGAIAGFSRGALGRLGSMAGLKPSAFAPSGVELSHGAARLIGEEIPLEVAPHTVAEAISSARLGALADMSPWAAVGADTYGVGLRALDAASWFLWRPGAVTGDIASMLGELSEWLAGRLGRSQIAHPWVRHLDALLGHLDMETRRRVVEVALPVLRDASQLGSLHTGAQLAGGVLSGQTPLPVPSLPLPPSMTSADVAATWRTWSAQPT